MLLFVSRASQAHGLGLYDTLDYGFQEIDHHHRETHDEEDDGKFILIIFPNDNIIRNVKRRQSD